MNINLDIKEDQLVHLDGDLREFFTNLSEDQKMLIVQTYFNKKLDTIEKEYNTYWMSNADLKWKDLSKYLSEGIRDKIQYVATEKLTESEEFSGIVDEIIKAVQPELYDIITRAIGSYVIDHLFVDKEVLVTTVNRSITNHYYESHVDHN